MLRVNTNKHFNPLNLRWLSLQMHSKRARQFTSCLQRDGLICIIKQTTASSFRTGRERRWWFSRSRGVRVYSHSPVSTETTTKATPNLPISLLGFARTRPNHFPIMFSNLYNFSNNRKRLSRPRRPETCLCRLKYSELLYDRVYLKESNILSSILLTPAPTPRLSI